MLLRGAGRSEEGAALFSTLYRSWCHSLGAVLSLCFLAEVRARGPRAMPSRALGGAGHQLLSACHF